MKRASRRRFASDGSVPFAPVLALDGSSYPDGIAEHFCYQDDTFAAAYVPEEQSCSDFIQSYDTTENVSWAATPMTFLPEQTSSSALHGNIGSSPFYRPANDQNPAPVPIAPPIAAHLTAIPSVIETPVIDSHGRQRGPRAPEKSRAKCTKCSKTFSRSFDLQRHANKHDPEKRVHVCRFKDWDYPGSYRKDKICQHLVKIHSEECTENGKILPNIHCGVLDCDWEGSYPRAMQLNHLATCHPDLCKDGVVLPFHDCWPCGAHCYVSDEVLQTNLRGRHVSVFGISYELCMRCLMCAKSSFVFYEKSKQVSQVNESIQNKKFGLFNIVTLVVSAHELVPGPPTILAFPIPSGSCIMLEGLDAGVVLFHGILSLPILKMLHALNFLWFLRLCLIVFSYFFGKTLFLAIVSDTHFMFP